MNENEIANNLKQNVPVAPEPAPATPHEPGPFGVADAASPTFELDEITQYKLHDYFNQPFKAHDEASKQRVQFLFEKVADMVGTTDYGFVVAKMRDLESMLGITQSEQRLYKLYQWVKLDSLRRGVEREMDTIHG